MSTVPFLPPGYGSARFKFSCVGVDHTMGFTTHHFFGAAAPSTIAMNLSQLFENDVLDDGGGMGTQYTYLGCDATVIGLDEVPVVDEHAASVEGTLSVNSIPPNCAHLITKRTAFAGRHYRGRIFFPPAMLFDVDIDASGNMTGALAASHTALWEVWRTNLSSADMGMVLAHQIDPEDPDPVTIVPTPVTALVASAKLATQRRRLR